MASGVIPWQQLTILLTVATASHFAFRRFKLPTIMGEILIGIMLGPSVLGLLVGPDFFDPVFTGIFAALGAIVLLFLIGLESDIAAIYSRKNAVIALGGVLLPWLGGYLLAELWLPGETYASKVFIGATMVATSTAVAAAILAELKAVKTDVAMTIVGAAVIDDVLGLIVLSFSTAISRGPVNLADIVLLVAWALLFLGVGILIGVRYLNRLVSWAEMRGRRHGLRHTGFTLGLGLTFLYAFVASSAGLHPIVGAFLAGAVFSKSSLIEDFQQGGEYLGAIFTPIFFVSMGIQVNLLAFGTEQGSIDVGLIVFGVVLAVVAIATKVVGCWIPAELSKMSRKKSIAIGFGMAPRGEVGLAIASTALGLGIIRPALYSITVLAVLITTVVPIPIFRRCLRGCIKEDLEQRLIKSDLGD